MSKDAVAVVSLIGAYFALRIFAGSYVEQTAGYFTFCIKSAQSGQALDGMLSSLLIQGLMTVVKTVGPVLVICILCAVTATFAQTNFLFSTESIKPKFSRLNPLQGFKRLFSLKSVVETLKNLIKIILLMVLIYFSVRDMFQESSKYLYTDIPVSVAHIVECASAMIVRIIIAFVAVAALDYFYQWWDYEKNMKMTKQEVKEEYKQMEGDPQVKGKIKQIQRQRAQQRMMQQVPQADVVIRNPTHYAVALRYKPETDAAPIVLAKGQDELALRIVRVAEEHNVAVMENVPLARALYAGAELDREIPPELYEAVAEVLVYIFRLDKDRKIVTSQ